jgi:hypothetical protein
VRKSGVVLTDAPAQDERPVEERILSRLKLGPRTKAMLSKELGIDRKTLQPFVDVLFAAEPRRVRGADIIVNTGKGGSRVVSGIALVGGEEE